MYDETARFIAAVARRLVEHGEVTFCLEDEVLRCRFERGFYKYSYHIPIDGLRRFTCVEFQAENAADEMLQEVLSYEQPS